MKKLDVYLITEKGTVKSDLDYTKAENIERVKLEGADNIILMQEDGKTYVSMVYGHTETRGYFCDIYK